MLSIESLKQYGADTSDGLMRCMGNEEFYFKLIRKVIEDKNFDALNSAIESGNLDLAFEAAHSLKGVLGNLALKPLYDPVFEITELLRSRIEVDYKPYLEIIEKKRAELVELAS